MPNVDHNLITPNMSVDSILTDYPQTASVFVAHGMACVGCPLSRFHTLAEAAAIYDLDLAKLLNELRCTIQTDSSSSRM